MRLILSRKGFDSTSGGAPSPIFADGSMLSLPIPDRGSPVRYADIRWRGSDLGGLVERLTGGALRGRLGAHLDPDLRRDARPRSPGWRPVLGQVGAAQGHLRNQGVAPGDLFLFFGLFREVDARLRWIGRPRHVVWGWLAVDAIVGVDETVRPARTRRDWAWAAGHPHLALPRDPSNTLYVAREQLELLGARFDGAGVFESFHPSRQLTATDAGTPSSWRLPAAFLPAGGPVLSYHPPERWTRAGPEVLLRAAGRGQEFVLDLTRCPGALEWAVSLLAGGV
jgi:hypothetical protein